MIARRKLLIGAMLVLVLVAGLTGAFAWRGDEERVGPTVEPPAALPAAEAAYYAALAPPLRAAVAEARSLVALGERKSRNLLAIRAAQERMTGVLDDIDALLRSGPTPDRFTPAVHAYGRGAAAVRAAMDDAQAGLMRFDWERVARATEVMGQGAAELARASNLLDAAAGEAVASPSAGHVHHRAALMRAPAVVGAALPGEVASDVL